MRLPLSPSMFGVGLVGAGLLVAFIFWFQRGAHIQLKGSVLKVRTLSLEPESTIAVLDFRITNPADYEFVIGRVEVFLEDGSGQRIQADNVAEVDAKRLFEYYPILGQKYNETLLMRDRVPARQTWDRMICVRVAAPETQVLRRKQFVVRMEDVDGPVAEIGEASR